MHSSGMSCIAVGVACTIVVYMSCIVVGVVCTVVVCPALQWELHELHWVHAHICYPHNLLKLYVVFELKP